MKVFLVRNPRLKTWEVMEDGQEVKYESVFGGRNPRQKTWEVMEEGGYEI